MRKFLRKSGSILEDAAEGNYTVTATYTGTGNYEGSITIAAPYVVSPEGDTRADITGDDTVSVSINASSQTAPSNLTAQISAGETALAVNDFTYVGRGTARLYRAAKTARLKMCRRVNIP